MKFAVQDCPWGSSSPTGQVPALDTEGGYLIGSDDAESIASQFEGAREIINHLQHTRITANLDSHLSPAALADSLSFITLLETKVIPALLYTTWCEDEAYSRLTRPAMGMNLPFPLSRWLPYSARKGVRAQLGSASSEDIYKGACKALDAVSARLVQAANDGYFFGDQPSTLDSHLFACLAYLRSAPVVHPDLRKKFESHSALVRYVDRVGGQVFSAPVPSAEQVEMKWSSWGTATGRGGGGSGGASSSFSTEINYKGKLWLIGAAVSIAGYVLLSGQYIDVSYGYPGELAEDEEGEELD